MASNTKIVLRKKPNKEGLYPLAIRISKNRRTTYQYLGHYIDICYWDQKNIRVRKSHPNANHLNSLLISKLSEVNKKLINLQSENKDLSVIHIKQELFPSSQFRTFNEVADEYLNELETTNKLARLSADRSRVNHVLNFVDSKPLNFQEIDEHFLRRFKVYLKKDLEVSERSVANNLVVIRTIYNRAIKMGIIDRKFYPFGSNKIRIKFPEAEKIGLTIEEVKKIENASELTDSEIHARDVWLFSFYFAGIRIADVLKIRWSDIYDNRLHYKMNKNSKLLSLKIPEKVLPILNKYINQKRDDNDFVFPELKIADINDAKDIYAKTKSANRNLNSKLDKVAEKAKVKKKITMHIARHTFGTISEDKIPLKMLQKLYRHSSLTTTIGYQSNFIHQQTDDALDKVINF